MVGCMENTSCFLLVSFFLTLIASPVLCQSQQVLSLSPLHKPVELSSISVDEKLEWGVKTQPEGDSYRYYLQSVSYQSQGNSLWTVPLPDWLANHAIGWSYKQPIDISREYGFPFLIGTIITDKAVWIAQGSGVLVLDKQTGKILGEEIAEPSPDHFFVDRGMATIITPTQRCVTQAGRLGRFFTKCDEYLVYFNGSNIWVWNQENQLVEQTDYKPERDDIETNQPFEYKIKVVLKTMTLEITGSIIR